MSMIDYSFESLPIVFNILGCIVLLYNVHVLYETIAPSALPSVVLGGASTAHMGHTASWAQAFTPLTSPHTHSDIQRLSISMLFL